LIPLAYPVPIGYCMRIQLFVVPALPLLIFGSEQTSPGVRGMNRGQCRTVEEQREPDVCRRRE